MAEEAKHHSTVYHSVTQSELAPNTATTPQDHHVIEQAGENHAACARKRAVVTTTRENGTADAEDTRHTSTPTNSTAIASTFSNWPKRNCKPTQK